MEIKRNIYIQNDAVERNLTRITNQIYKLLPSREEGEEWKKPLETVIVELSGMNILFLNQHEIFFSLLCKLEGLGLLTNEQDFFLYRRTIFECLSLMGELISYVKS